jgi:hypothetical protein
MVGFPRSLAERACTAIRYWNEPGKGGHFLAAEEPELAAAEIQGFMPLLIPTRKSHVGPLQM